MDSVSQTQNEGVGLMPKHSQKLGFLIIRIAAVAVLAISGEISFAADALTAASRDADMRDTVSVFKNFYVPSNLHNHTDKSISDWTARDLEQVGPKDLETFRVIFETDQLPIADALVPKGMSRADFLRAVLRESARRGTVKDDYINSILVKPEQRTQEVELIRTAYGIANALPAQVRELAGVIAIHDAAVDIVTTNPAYFPVQPDLADAVGLNRNTVLPLKTDERTFDFGYTAGSIQQFKNNDGLNIVASSPLSPAQLQEKFCPVVHNLFQSGRAYDNCDAFWMGFYQARIDIRTNFEPITEHVGLFAQCAF